MSVDAVLLKGGTVYSPNRLGRKDVLILGSKIARIADQLSPPQTLETKRVDVSDKLLIPGLLDLHVHLIGGGGEDGPSSRVPELTISEILSAGITTVVGVLGTDHISRSLETLLAKVKAFRDTIDAFMYTGSYHYPSATVTDSLSKDLALIDEIIGVKLAISDHRSATPTRDQLTSVAAKTRMGAMLGEKPGLVHLHIGRGAKGLNPMREVVDNSEIPITQFLPTHVSRSPELLSEGREFVKSGGCIDLTVPGTPEREDQFTPLVESLFKADLDTSHVTISSDGNGSLPKFDPEGNLIEVGRGKVSRLFESTFALAESESLTLEQALPLVTSNPAARLGLGDTKGQIREGYDADLVAINQGPDYQVEEVFSGGKHVVKAGEPLIRGKYD
ncbi:MAG: beta-aspartyl-peptidase [Candidatus Bipolaricaulota bacterium]